MNDNDINGMNIPESNGGEPDNENNVQNNTTPEEPVVNDQAELTPTQDEPVNAAPQYSEPVYAAPAEPVQVAEPKRKNKKEGGSTLLPLAISLSGLTLVALFGLMIALIITTVAMGGNFAGSDIVGDNSINGGVGGVATNPPQDEDETEVVQVQVNSSNSQVTYTDDTEMLSHFLNSVVVVSTERESGSGVGSGVILSENGYIITNHHVIEDAVSVYVKLYGEKDYVKATIVGYSENDDVAVLKIDKKGLRAATFVSDCSTCLIGERVYAIGSPEGTDYSWTVTQGIISSVNRYLKMYDDQGTLEKKMRVIQTDASVNPGNSGGPLINSRGEVVGIITMKLLDSAGMGFALPSDGVLELATAIIEKGSADHIDSTIASGRPLMGITCVSVQKDKWYKTNSTGIEEVTPNSLNSFHTEEDGVYVMSTSAGMDAHGKLMAGDIITEINGTRIYTQYQLMSVLNDLSGGDSVTITYYRGGEYFEISITLKEAPIPQE